MDGIHIIRQYVSRIVHGDGKCDGMKVLLLDNATTQIVSTVFSQTEILNEQVYLVSNIMQDTLLDTDPTGSPLGPGGQLSPSQQQQQQQQPQKHLKAICFIRPTSVEFLARELQNPRFAEYHIFVSAILPSGLLRTLAQADATHQRVRQVQELYADFIPMNADVWSLQQKATIPMTMAAGTSWAPQHATHYERTLQGIQSMLLALRRQPACIRYAAHSPCAEEIAKDLAEAITGDDIFHFRRNTLATTTTAAGAASSSTNSTTSSSSGGSGLHVLILDRRDDPVTPLLSQWTYQAMIHELLGLNNHRVLLRGAPNVPKDLEEVVLSDTHDPFFRENRYKNFGELGESVQRLLKDYQTVSAQHNVQNLNSIEDMQAFLEKFPELRSQSHTVSKHVAILGELARLVEVCSLMEVSQFEQQLACTDDQNAHWRELLEKLQSRSIKIPDKLRLGLLFALRYEQSANIHMLQSAMTKGGVPPDMVNLVPVLLRYAGAQTRGPGLFGDHHLVAKVTKSILSSVQGVENVYAQHVPALMTTLQALCKGKLSFKSHPAVGNAAPPPGSIPDEILIFVVGGITYEEGTKIWEFNQQHHQHSYSSSLMRSATTSGAGVGMGGTVHYQPQVILAGSTVHNSTSFLDEIRLTVM